ncbi:unnamed protein product [Larinioides sclopetarius]|uniref:Uncharacterized protein n=1 Tax=Larinioides sclopetarius TaxID=280406 RepID=A0AAV2A326_9ARAC
MYSVSLFCSIFCSLKLSFGNPWSPNPTLLEQPTPLLLEEFSK